MTADEDFERIRARVISLRAARGMTLQQVADRAGCTKSHVWDFERGKASNPTLRMLRGLADCYGVSLSELVGDDASTPRLHPDAMAVAVQVDEAIRRAALSTGATQADSPTPEEHDDIWGIEQADSKGDSDA